MTESPQVVRNDDAGRYELRIDGELVSIADFTDRGDAIVVPHVETTPRRRGNGYADMLMAGVVADLRERGVKIIPLCPFARSFLATVPDRDELVA